MNQLAFGVKRLMHMYCIMFYLTVLELTTVKLYGDDHIPPISLDNQHSTVPPSLLCLPEIVLSCKSCSHANIAIASYKVYIYL